MLKERRPGLVRQPWALRSRVESDMCWKGKPVDVTLTSLLDTVSIFVLLPPVYLSHVHYYSARSTGFHLTTHFLESFPC